LSNDGANTTAERLGRGVVTVVPVTSNVARIYPFQILPAKECDLRADSKAQAERVRPVAAERIGQIVGHVPSELMTALEDALRLHLAL